MRHADPVAHLTTAELALIPAATALAGVAIGVGGNAYLGKLGERRAARRRSDQAITDVLTSAVDLISGVQAMRSAYRQRSWVHYIRVAAVVVAAAGTAAGPGGQLSTEILGDWHRLGPGFERILAADRDLDGARRTAVLDMVTIMLPRSLRFYTAVTELTLGPDKQIAAAARNLAPAVAALLEVTTAPQRKYDRARHRAQRALGQFRDVVDKRR
jgi:hypothetical protein